VGLEEIDDGEFLETMVLVGYVNFVFGRDHRIRLMSTLDSSSSGDPFISHQRLAPSRRLLSSF
jgi:hypothetical protein